MEKPTNKPNLEFLVEEQLNSGLEPFILEYYPIVNPDSKNPVAYRCILKVNSSLIGEIKEDVYFKYLNGKAYLRDLFKEVLRMVVRSYQPFLKKDLNINFLSIHCPNSLITSKQVQVIVTDVLRENPWFNPRKLCIEIDANIMSENLEVVRTTLLDLKLLKVQTMIIKVGNDNFPILKLPMLSFSNIMLSEELTVYAGSRNKPQLLSNLVSYLESMDTCIYAEGEEKYRKPMRNTGCVGYFINGTVPRTIDEACAEGEGD